MKTIRASLGLGAGLLFAGGLGILVAANGLLLEPYYAAQTRGAFKAIAEAVARLPAQGDGRLEAAKVLAAGTPFRIVLADRSGTVRLSSAPEFQPGQSFPLPREEADFLAAHISRLEAGREYFGILNSPPPGQSVLHLMSSLGDGDFLVVTQPLENFRRSIRAAATFTLLMGFLILILESALVLLLSGRMTRPILELAKVAQRVAAADLGARWEGHREDELGILGESLNAMTAALARSIAGLTSANDGLARQVRAQEDFMAGASHELKTPVGLMRGYAEAIQLGLYSSEEERVELAGVIVKEADHLDRLVRDLSSIAAVGAGPRSLYLAELKLEGLLEETVSRFALEAKARGLALVLEAEGPALVSADPDRILQVLDNLISNALRHCPKGGTIALRLKELPMAWRIEVENSGSSVEEAHLARLFEPFYRVDPSRSQGSGGSGLGLALVRAVLEAHNGSCGAANTEGGFLAWAELPRPNLAS